MSKRGLGTIAFVLVLAAPEVASAQAWLKDRRHAQGVGIRAGDLELHPGIGGEIGYDSNWFLRSDKEAPDNVNSAPQAPVLDTAMLRITPSLSLGTATSAQRLEGDHTALEPPKLVFRAGISATYREFFPLGGSDADKTRLRDQRNISGAADVHLDILPQRPWGAALWANYLRTIQPTVIGQPDISFNRHNIGLGGEVIAVPGGGTLDWRLGYQAQLTLFEDQVASSFQNTTHEGRTRGRWRFRPRTALVYDATLRFSGYTNNVTRPGALHDSTPVRARLGLNGLVTPRFALLAMAGWGASFFDTRADARVEQFDSLIAQAEAKWYPSANPGSDPGSDVSLTLSSVAVGYTRDFANSFLADFYGLDRGYMNVSYFFAGRALLSLEGGVAALQYPNFILFDNSIKSEFTDIRADATLFGEYRFTDAFGINTTLRFTGNFSQNRIPQPVPIGGSPVFYDMNWKRFEAFIGARYFL